jgi:hypothetical protein
MVAVKLIPKKYWVPITPTTMITNKNNNISIDE